MKSLAIFRHAKSEPGDRYLSDFDRNLNERGRREAELVGREMRDRGLSFDLVLTSPAKRAVETLMFAEKGFAGSPRVSHDQRIYEAHAHQLLAIVRGIDDNAGNVLLVGHNPALQQLILALVAEDERGLRRQVEAKLPPAALAVIRLGVDRWSDVDAQTGEIAELILPNELGD